MPLDPDAARFLKRWNESPALPIWAAPLAESRAGIQPLPGAVDEVGAVHDLRIPAATGDVAVRMFEPPESALGTVVYCHGGGWVTGSLDSHDALCRRLCRESQGRIVSVDYRLAPEHPFPAAVDDAWAATVWAAKTHGLEAGVAVCGDSAGGNLAAATALRARDRRGPRINAQALIYPITDCDFERPSYLENSEGYFLTRKMMRWFWDQYVPEPADRRRPEASPLHAEDLSGLPPAWIFTAGYDVLRDEGIAYAERLREAGVAVTAVHRPGLIHGFLRRLHEFRDAGRLCRDIGRFLRDCWEDAAI